MPIYEFKCLKCGEFIELLFKNQDDTVELICPSCKSEDLERVLSVTSHSMGDGSQANQGVKSQTKTCSGGTCSTFEIPGPTR